MEAYNIGSILVVDFVSILGVYKTIIYTETIGQLLSHNFLYLYISRLWE